MKSNQEPSGQTSTGLQSLAGRRILFANFPGDGHFNPLTGLAVHLKWLGCDVRWYTSPMYEQKVRDMDIPFFPYQKAIDISRFKELFPEREKIKGMIRKLNFDILNVFVLRGEEYFEDLKEVYKEFPFEAVIADCAFTGIPFVTDKMQIPVLAIGVMPLVETSKDLPAPGLGLTPNYSWLGQLKHRIQRLFAAKVIFGKPNRVMQDILSRHGIDHMNLGIFDIVVKKSNLFLQSGTPGFEYFRSDLGANIRYLGALLPFRRRSSKPEWHDPRLNQFDNVVIATQGTVESDVEKLLVPTLEALKNTDTLVIVTTGGSQTEELRKRYPHENIIIEDFIAFSDIMPYADAYITNGGYGGVMLGIEYQLPLVVAGVHEGKNEINARIGYFKLGINLKTEKPTPQQIRKAVHTVLHDKQYRENVKRLQKEFTQYDPAALCASYLKEVLEKVPAPVKTIRADKRESVMS
jgi:MGT family glycosyltransferase